MMHGRTNDRCKHFRGTFHNKTCEAGVHMRNLVGGHDHGWLIRLPCLDDHVTSIVCDKKCKMTAEEFAAEEAELKALIKHSEEVVFPLMAKLKREYKQHVRKSADSFPCPMCKQGTLHYIIASTNGHLHMRCTHPGCCSVME